MNGLSRELKGRQDLFVFAPNFYLGINELNENLRSC